ncbi:hypothetical protein ACN47E_008793 [Coniothyrium glycines]
MSDGTESGRRRSACDECRLRKVKCSGEQPCRNCQDDGVFCSFSNSKPVGRPRKRPRHTIPVGENVFAIENPSPKTTTDTSMSLDLDTVFSPDAFSGYSELLLPPETPDSSVSLNASTLESVILPAVAPCSCLSLAYLTITRLQYPAANDLSTAIADIKAALAAAGTILRCHHCPKQMVTAVQNLYQLSTLLISLVGRMQTVLVQVDDGAQTGPLLDSSAFCYPPSPDSQQSNDGRRNEHRIRLFFRKMLKETILGNHDDVGDTTLLGIMNQFENRQKEWHEDPGMYEKQAKMYGKRTATNFAHECKSRSCYTIISTLKASITSLDL